MTSKCRMTINCMNAPLWPLLTRAREVVLGIARTQEGQALPKGQEEALPHRHQIALGVQCVAEQRSESEVVNDHNYCCCVIVFADEATRSYWKVSPPAIPTFRESHKLDH